MPFNNVRRLFKQATTNVDIVDNLVPSFRSPAVSTHTTFVINYSIIATSGGGENEF